MSPTRKPEVEHAAVVVLALARRSCRAPRRGATASPRRTRIDARNEYEVRRPPACRTTTWRAFADQLRRTRRCPRPRRAPAFPGGRRSRRRDGRGRSGSAVRGTARTTRPATGRTQHRRGRRRGDRRRAGARARRARREHDERRRSDRLRIRRTYGPAVREIGGCASGCAPKSSPGDGFGARRSAFRYEIVR